MVAMTASPGPYDAALSALRNHVDGLGASLAAWEARQDGPDVHATETEASHRAGRVHHRARPGPASPASPAGGGDPDMNYQSTTGLRCFMFALGAVFASSPEEADRFASEHGLWDRRPRTAAGRDGERDPHHLALVGVRVPDGLRDAG